MSDLPTQRATELLSRAAEAAETLLTRFAEEATPDQALELGRLIKEARELERRAQVATQVIETNEALAHRALDLRAAILAATLRGLEQDEARIDGLIDRIVAVDDPALVSALAEALATITTSGRLREAGEAMAAVKADKVDLVF